MKIDEKKIAVFQIVLLVGMVFSFSYFTGIAFGGENSDCSKEESWLLKIYEKVVKFVFSDKNIVSAFDFGSIVDNIDPMQLIQQIQNNAEGGLSMCVETNTNKKCQIMPNSACEKDCKAGQCTRIANSVSEDFTNVPEECKLGTCQDPEEGVCLPNSPKGECENNGGSWFDNPTGNFAECNKGCCVIGSEVQFITELQCDVFAEGKGIEFPSDLANFDSELNDELSCLMFAQKETKGACTFEMGEEKKDCKLASRAECDSMGGIFSAEGILCSNSELNTKCEAKNYTSCVDGFDEVYWFDSCGNMENIYGTDDSGKEGEVIPKSESCEIGDSENWLKNQGSCGNCNRLFSSTCGNKTESQMLSDSEQKVVCRDLGCEEQLADGTTVRREHGETWCAYQNNFGVFPIEIPAGSSLLRYASGSTEFLGGLINAKSIGPPGSQFFRESCNEGVIEIESCQSARGGICVETRESVNGTNKETSVATCRANRWQECVNYNPPDRGEGFAGKIKVELNMIKCEQDPDCFVKNVNVGKDFSFPVCLPKYPPGFNLGDGDSGGESICGYASQTCPAVFVKEAVGFGFGGARWVCKANCDCIEGNDPDTAQPSAKFVQEMSDFCTSLGDCGIKLNYRGAPSGSGGFGLKKCVTGDIEGECKKRMPTFSMTSLISGLINPALQIAEIKTVPGKYINASDIEAFAKSLGASTSGPESLLSNIFGGGGLEGFLDEFEGGGGGGLYSGYKGSELPAIAAVPGAGALGFYGAAHAGWFSTTSYSLVLHSAEGFGTSAIHGGYFASSSQAGVAASSVQGGLGESAGQVAVVSQTGPMSPAMQAFSGGLTGAAIATAAVSLIIAFSGMAAGLGKAGSYFYMGSGAIGGGLTGAGLAGTYSAGSSIPVGASLVEGSTFTVGTVGATLGEGAYVVGGETMAVGAGGLKVGTGIAVTVGEGGGSIAGGGATAGVSGAAGAEGAGATGTATAAGATPLLVVGIVILVIVFTMLILNWITGVGEMKKVEVTAECKPWQPPVGSSSEVCNSCGEDGFPCNDYACNSLGANCRIVGEAPNIVCEDMSPNDISGPQISSFEEVLQEEFEMSSSSDSGFEIEKTQGRTSCLENFQSVTVGIKTDEYSWCKLSFDPEAEFEDMVYLGGDNSLRKEHTHVVSSIDVINYFDDIGQPLEPEKETDVKFYVKCQDAKGNPNVAPYTIDLCVVRADWTAPLLTLIGPFGKLPYGTNETKVVVRSNEPVELRWSFSDVSFGDMENRFVCPISEAITDCWAMIPISQDKTNIYVRGKDQPGWMGTDRESERNENQESLPIVLTRTDSKLKIIFAMPDDGKVIKTGSSTAAVEFEVRVSGGDQITTSCYIGKGRIDSLEIESPGVYKKIYDRYRTGLHKVWVECEDGFGNKDEREISFRVVTDSDSPTVTRVYDDSGTLVVITAEEATCGFGYENCKFKVEDSELMSGTGTVHSISFDQQATYYIKCKDELGNERSNRCDLVVAGGLF